MTKQSSNRGHPTFRKYKMEARATCLTVGAFFLSCSRFPRTCRCCTDTICPACPRSYQNGSSGNIGDGVIIRGITILLSSDKALISDTDCSVSGNVRRHAYLKRCRCLSGFSKWSTSSFCSSTFSIPIVFILSVLRDFELLCATMPKAFSKYPMIFIIVNKHVIVHILSKRRYQRLFSGKWTKKKACRANVGLFDIIR